MNKEELRNIVNECLKKQIHILNSRINKKLENFRTEEFSDMKIYEPVFSILDEEDSLTTVRFEYGGLALWIAEYGSGSTMDLNNPYLKDYNINPNRKDRGYVFLGRSKGDVVHKPDGTSYVSSGKLRNYNLEKSIFKGRLGPYYPVNRNNVHIIHEEVSMWWQGEVIPELKNLIKEYMVSSIEVRLREALN